MEGEQKIRVLIFSPLIYEYFLINSDRFMMKFISCLISERVSEMKNVVQKSRNVKSFFISIVDKKVFLAHYFQQLSSTQSHSLSLFHCFIISTSSRDFSSSYLLHTFLCFEFNFVFFFFLLLLSSFYLIISNDDFYFTNAVFLRLLLLLMTNEGERIEMILLIQPDRNSY